MSTSILAEKKTTEKMESKVVNYDYQNLTDTLTSLDELLYDIKSYTHHTARKEPIYDIPRSIESHYDVPKKISVNSNASALAIEPIYAIPNKQKTKEELLANRPLPQIPNEALSDNEPIYQEIAELKSSKGMQNTKMSPNQIKNYLLEGLERYLLLVKEAFANIKKSFDTHLLDPSNEAVKISQNTIPLDPLVDEKIKLELAEIKFSEIKTLENFQNLINHLKNFIFVLEGRVTTSIKVYESAYGEQLGTKLTQPMSQAKLELNHVKARLAEVSELKSELINTALSTEILPVSGANNRFTFFGKPANISVTMEDNPNYESVEIVKNMLNNSKSN